jgi:hypothetical protein
MLTRARKDSAKEKEQEKSLQQDDSELNKTALTGEEEDYEDPQKRQTSDESSRSRSHSNILQVASSNSTGATELTSDLPSEETENPKKAQTVLTIQSSSSAGNKTLISTLKLAKSQWENFVSIMFSMLVLIVSSVLKGGEGRPSILGLESCSAGGWAIFVTTQVICVGLAVCTYKWNKFSFDEEDKDVKDAHDAIMRPLLRKKLLWASYTTGVLAGFLGIGGGMVLGLYMLNLGMDIQVSTALSTFVVLFSSASTTFQFVVAGAIQIRHAWLLMILGLTGSSLGNYCLKAILRKYSKPSALFWILSVVLTISAIVLPVEVVRNLLDKNKSALTFGSLC